MRTSSSFLRKPESGNLRETRKRNSFPYFWEKLVIRPLMNREARNIILRRFAPEGTFVGMRRCAAFPTYAFSGGLFGSGSSGLGIVRLYIIAAAPFVKGTAVRVPAKLRS
jgi:hypothetical protein